LGRAPTGPDHRLAQETNYKIKTIQSSSYKETKKERVGIKKKERKNELEQAKQSLPSRLRDKSVQWTSHPPHPAVAAGDSTGGLSASQLPGTPAIKSVIIMHDKHNFLILTFF
jgi:chemotaxis response regulator CheB